MWRQGEPTWSATPGFHLQTPSTMPDPLNSSHLGDVGYAVRHGHGLLDPGAAGPQLPMLRSGGSTPPRAKFRQQPVSAIHGMVGGLSSDPRSCQSSARGDATWGSPLAVPHGWEHGSPRDATLRPPGAGPTGMVVPGRRAAASRASPWAAAPSVSASSTSSPRTDVPPGVSPAQQQIPLRAALQQLRNVTEGLAHARRSGSRSQTREDAAAAPRRGAAPGGAHAGAGSPSPEERARHGNGAAKLGSSGTQEDKYLKILQSLQAKGAVGGGLAAQLLEGASMPRAASASASRRGPARRAASSDSDSSSTSD